VGVNSAKFGDKFSLFAQNAAVVAEAVVVEELLD